MQISTQSTTKKKIFTIIGIAIFLALSAAVFIYVGRPLLRFLAEPEQFRVWVDGHGLMGRVAFVGMMVLQIIVAFIPGEPLEIVAGYAFGAIEGTILCLIGCFIGGMLVFLFVRHIGVRAVEVFFPREKILSLKFLRNSKRLNLLAFILFLIPGTPKDLMTYFVGLTNMKLTTWMLITSVARIPSVITSTIGGDALGLQNYQFAIIVFAITIVISAGGLLWYRHMSRTQPGDNPSGTSGEPPMENVG